jgi:hypothetical protein
LVLNPPVVRIYIQTRSQDASITPRVTPHPQCNQQQAKYAAHSRPRNSQCSVLHATILPRHGSTAAACNAHGRHSMRFEYSWIISHCPWHFSDQRIRSLDGGEKEARTCAIHANVLRRPIVRKDRWPLVGIALCEPKHVAAILMTAPWEKSALIWPNRIRNVLWKITPAVARYCYLP